jgi:hypothetical protein
MFLAGGAALYYSQRLCAMRCVRNQEFLALLALSRVGLKYAEKSTDVGL